MWTKPQDMSQVLEWRRQFIRTAIEAIETTPFLSQKEKQDIFYNNAVRFS